MYDQQPQMRLSFGRSLGPVTKALLIANVAVFCVQALLDRGPHGIGSGILSYAFGLSRHGLSQFMIWQPVTYLFLHGGLFHLLGNMLGVFFFGGELEHSLGSRRFLRLYFVTGVLAGVGWLLFSERYCIGASGSVCGTLAAFAAMFPHRRITLLLFFVLPVTVRARVLAIGYAVLTVYLMIEAEGTIAHAVHLVGGIIGYVWGLRLVPSPHRRRRPPPPAWAQDPMEKHRRTFEYVPEPEEEYEEDDPEPSAEEVNAILEKIQERGIKSLTRRERRILQRAASGGGKNPFS